MSYEWKEEFVSDYVDGANSLAKVLNKLEADGWEVFQIISTTSTDTRRDGDISTTNIESVVARKEIIPRTCDNCANLGQPSPPLFLVRRCLAGVTDGASDCGKFVEKE